MKTALWFGTVTVLALGTVSFGQQTDGKQYCQSVVQCYQEAVKLAKDCQQQNSNRKPANGTSTKAGANCKAVVAEKTTQIKEKEVQHRQMDLDCLTSRVSEAMPVSAKQSAKCDDAPSDGNGNGQRSKRQDILTNSVSSNSTDGSDGGAANGGGKGGHGKGKGKGHGKGQGKGKGGGCQKQVKQKQQQCKKIAKCCSEVQYCHLKFELSDLHDQIRQLQLDILEQRHQCQKQQQAQGASSGASSNSTMLKDSPIDEDEDEFQFDHDDDEE